MIVGIVGKPNTGKSTFFNATTMASVPVASYPFTTIEPNIGVAYIRKKCMCEEFDVQDNPQNSSCIERNRFIPFRLVDTAGLVPGAWRGRGLGNQFLDKISRADVLIHVVDAAGATDFEGNSVPAGSHDPLRDIEFLENELVRWFEGIIKKDWGKMVRKAWLERQPLHHALYQKLSGLNFNIEQIQEAVTLVDEDPYRGERWGEEQRLNLARNLLAVARPILIAANKVDIPQAEANIKNMREVGHIVFPLSAISELVLRKASNKKYIYYMPGDTDFRVLKREKLTNEQLSGLRRIRERVMRKFGGAGTQQILNHAVFEVLSLITVYPVSNAERVANGSGNVLPDVYLLPRGSTVRDLAENIHSDIAKSILFGIDARTKMRLGPDHRLRDNDVIQIVSAAR